MLEERLDDHSGSTKRLFKMKSMKLRAELLLLTGGTCAALWMISYVFIYESLSIHIRELFRGGRIGAILIAVMYLGGIIGVLFFIQNVISGTREIWFFRLGFVLCFLFSAIFSGSLM